MKDSRIGIFGRYIFANLATLDLLEDVALDHRVRPQAVIFTGSQYVNNGTLLYLDIAELCKNEIPWVKFYLTDFSFASPAFRQQVLDSIKSRELTNIELLSNVKPHELMHLLNRATIAISPTLRVPQQIKGFHLKLYEYLAASLPIVASDLPHEVALIASNQCGILAQPENPQSFANAIVKLVRNREFACRLGKNGQNAFKEKYPWESELPKLLECYDRILAN
jgi:glycosyltransferase involved in cell wall biosynthesis